jgi:hypothetical protein
MAVASTTTPRLEAMLGGDDRPPAERRRLIALIQLLAALPPPPDRHARYPAFAHLQERLLAAIDGASAEALENALLELYAHLHGNVAPYSRDERRTVDRTGGYWCHAGGLSPILKAPDWLGPATCSMDLGAGNGLQLLLVQKLAPHRRTVQVEISAAMCAAGRELQEWLGIPDERVEWCQADVTAQSIAGVDFLYLYRPVRPEGAGAAFYRRLARDLDADDAPSVIFSIADCLGAFLPPRFERLHFDGHLACFRRRVRRPATRPPRASRGR